MLHYRVYSSKEIYCTLNGSTNDLRALEIYRIGMQVGHITNAS